MDKVYQLQGFTNGKTNEDEIALEKKVLQEHIPFVYLWIEKQTDVCGKIVSYISYGEERTTRTRGRKGKEWIEVSLRLPTCIMTFFS